MNDFHFRFKAWSLVVFAALLCFSFVVSQTNAEDVEYEVLHSGINGIKVTHSDTLTTEQVLDVAAGQFSASFHRRIAESGVRNALQIIQKELQTLLAKPSKTREEELQISYLEQKFRDLVVFASGIPSAMVFFPEDASGKVYPYVIVPLKLKSSTPAGNGQTTTVFSVKASSGIPGSDTGGIDGTIGDVLNDIWDFGVELVGEVIELFPPLPNCVFCPIAWYSLERKEGFLGFRINL